MHQIHMKPKSGAQMPMCSFGTACNRKQCVYRHPPKAKLEKSAQVCPAFLLGECQFGARCRNVHVPEQDVERILQQYAQTMCRFGSRCCTAHCLFFHPPPEPCQHGARCPNPYCQFSHPEAATEEQEAEALARRAREEQTRTPALVFPKSKALLQREREEQRTTGEQQPYATVKVPSDVWVADYQRNPGVYLAYQDPVEKLLAVNAISPPGVIDLHFQKTAEVCHVLDLCLGKHLPELEWWEFYSREERTVWVVTGSGNHTTHSKAYVFDVVLDHLVQRGLRFKIAVNNGQQGGFLVWVV